MIKEKKKKPFDSKQIFATFTLGHNVISENIWPQMKVKHLNNLKKSSGKYWQKECRLGKTEQRKKHKMKIKAFGLSAPAKFILKKKKACCLY